MADFFDTTPDDPSIRLSLDALVLECFTQSHVCCATSPRGGREQGVLALRVCHHLHLVQLCLPGSVLTRVHDEVCLVGSPGTS